MGFLLDLGVGKVRLGGMVYWITANIFCFRDVGRIFVMLLYISLLSVYGIGSGNSLEQGNRRQLGDELSTKYSNLDVQLVLVMCVINALGQFV